MSSIFGKQTVAEPPYYLLLERNEGVDTSYEVRKYGKRFAATCTFISTAGDNNDMNSPFKTLAQYIGVFGEAKNEGSKKISMTAPVVTSGTKIDMTAPVATQSNSSGQKVMKFMLPVEYDEISKIPKPLDPAVKIEEIPPQTGAVHKYNGSWDDDRNKGIAASLGQQLIHDGVNITEEYVMENWQFWGYNPPFTIPYFRRNEVWVQLDDGEVGYLMENYPTEMVGEKSGAPSVVMEAFGSDGGLSSLSVGSLTLAACTAVGLLINPDGRDTQGSDEISLLHSGDVQII